MRKADWLIGLLIAALVLLGISYFVRTYKTIQNQNPDRPSVEETLKDMNAGETATLEEEDEYDEEEYPDDADTTLYESDDSTIDDLADLNAAKTAAAEEAAAAEAGSTGGASTETAVPESYGESSGNFLVVAGTFKQEINAQTQLKKFKKMGYSDAAIGKFNKSTYASLIVDRFATSAEAKKLVNALKSKGIESYVHEKR